MNERPFQIGDSVSFRTHGRIPPPFPFRGIRLVHGEVKALSPNYIGVEAGGVLFWTPAAALTLDASIEEKAEFFQSIYEA